MSMPQDHRFVGWRESNTAQWAHFRWPSIVFVVLFVASVFLLVHKPPVFTVALVVVYLGGTHLMGARYVRKHRSDHLEVDALET